MIHAIFNLYFCGKNWRVYCIYHVQMNVSCPDREDVITIHQEVFLSVFSIRSICPRVFECWGSDWENPSCWSGGSESESEIRFRCSGAMLMTHQTFLIIHLWFLVLVCFYFMIDKPSFKSTIYTLHLLAQCSASVWNYEYLKNHKADVFF